MFESDVDELDAAGTLAAATDAQADRTRADRALLELSLRFADLYPDPATIPDHVSLPGGERVWRCGGPGCPGFAEFAAAEFGAAIGRSAGSAAAFIGQSLALRHRFPLILAMVRSGHGEPWKARTIATACLALSVEAAAIVDRRVARIIDSVTPIQLDKIVKAAIQQADPDGARATAEQNAKERGVWAGRVDEHGSTTLTLRAATGAVIRFKATLRQLADALAELGHPGTLGQRMAMAVGIISDPTLTHELLTLATHLSPQPTPDLTPDEDPTPDPPPDSEPHAEPDPEPDTVREPHEHPGSDAPNDSHAEPDPAPDAVTEPHTDPAPDAVREPHAHSGSGALIDPQAEPAPDACTAPHAEPAPEVLAEAQPGTAVATDSAAAADTKSPAAPGTEPQDGQPAASTDAAPSGAPASGADWPADWFSESEPPPDDEADRDPPHPSDPEYDTPPQPSAADRVPKTPEHPDRGDGMDAAARRELAAKLTAIRQNADHRGPFSRPSKTTLYIHLTDHTLLAGEGVTRVERFGPVFTTRLEELLGQTQIIIKPVIDLNDNRINVNAYEIPDRIREHVKLTHPVEQFPYGTAETTNSTDLDHIQPYDFTDTGPPGQTSIANLTPLRRYSHRVKTHGDWQARRLDDGALEWTTRHGLKFRVDHKGTHRITNPTPAEPSEPNRKDQ